MRALSIGVVVGLLALSGCNNKVEEYKRKSKMSEYKLHLNRLSKGLKAYYVAKQELPATNGGPTPPPGSCCEGPNHRCAPTPELWTVPPWSDLEFEVFDAHFYSYQYERTAPDRAVLRAYGDLDCDTNISVYEMTVTVKDGVPTATEPVETAPD